MQKLISLLVLLNLLRFCSLAQDNREIDSLLNVVGTSKEDSHLVNTLNLISKKYLNTEPDKAIEQAKRSLVLAEKINFKPGSAYAFKNIGIALFNKGEYIEALKAYESSLEVFRYIHDKNGEANMYGNIGNIYFNKAENVKALEFYFKGLKLAEETKDTARIVTLLINIGAVSMTNKNQYDIALEKMQQALLLEESYEDNDANRKKDIIGAILVNIGEIYFEKEGNGYVKQYNDSALFYFMRSKNVYNEDSENLPYTLSYIGKAFCKEENFDAALKFQKLAYDKAMKLDAKFDIAMSLIYMGQTYQQKGDLNSALEKYRDAQRYQNELKGARELRDIYEGLALVYAKMKDYSNAYYYAMALVGIKDTLYDIESDKKLGTLQFTYDLEKKQSEVALLVKDQELKEKEISRGKLVRNGFIAGFAVVLLFAGVFFRQRNRIKREKQRSDNLLLNILPAEIAEELKTKGSAEAQLLDDVTVLFSDFVGFTQLAEKLTPKQLVAEINECFSAFDLIMQEHGIEKIKTIGDSYMAAGGLPVANRSHAFDVVRAALEIQQFMLEHKKLKSAAGSLYFEIRIGVHTGPVVAGIVGIKKFAYDIWGDTVNTASRMESSGEVGQVNISGSTYAIIKDAFNCTHRGKISAKGKGEVDMYFVSLS